jgi:membrane fusion protein (multidrug efflux system)
MKKTTAAAEAENVVEEKSKYLPMVKVFKVKREDYSDNLSANGTVKGSSEIELKFEISGKIASFNFREGDFVSEGEIIVSLDPEDVMTRLRHSKSKLESITSKYGAAKEKLKVYKELYEMGAIIRAKLTEMELSVDSIKSEVDTARSEVELAQSNLEKTVIDLVTPNDKAGTFLEIKNVFVEMGVIEKDIEKIEIGQKVKVAVDAYPDEVFWGTIDNISKMVRGETRTLPVKVIISNPGQRLLSGMYADCEIYLAAFTDTTIVPAASVINLGEMEVAPIVKGDDGKTGIIELRKIETSYSSSYTIVDDGLEEGDLVVMETQQPLKDGMEVRIIEVIQYESK